ncbi:MAG TPA: DUF4249 domain-containing protein [Chryseosolibacter sp.]|nr:DUF4249 domain-containing protein [Chryseosolibacter sp.]
MKKVHYIVLIGCLISCNTEPELEFGTYQPKLVVDGWIEQGNFPKVILTSSMSYFDALDSATVRKLVVTTAKVTVSDGFINEVLTLKKDESYFPQYIYTGTEIKGEVGKSYTLTIEYKGERYSASTTIPPIAELAKLWFETIPGKDSLGYIYGEFTDDPATDNYYRVFTQRENKDTRYIPVYLSAIGDQSFNGETFTFSLLRGPDSFTNVQDDLYFEKGDTIKVKFCTMDKSHFDFWRTLERELYVVGNPFASSGNEILSNVDNKNALGVWGGYGVKYYRVIAK